MITLTLAANETIVSNTRQRLIDIALEHGYTREEWEHCLHSKYVDEQDEVYYVLSMPASEEFVSSIVESLPELSIVLYKSGTEALAELGLSPYEYLSKL